MNNYSVFFKRRFLLHFVLVAGILGMIMAGSTQAEKFFFSSATAADSSRLSYRSVSVTSKDTLWSIAKENYTSEWGDFSDYLEEIKRCNSLTSEKITSGNSLIVPIYLP